MSNCHDVPHLRTQNIKRTYRLSCLATLGTRARTSRSNKPSLRVRLEMVDKKDMALFPQTTRNTSVREAKTAICYSHYFPCLRSHRINCVKSHLPFVDTWKQGLPHYRHKSMQSSGKRFTCLRPHVLKTVGSYSALSATRYRPFHWSAPQTTSAKSSPNLQGGTLRGMI